MKKFTNYCASAILTLLSATGNIVAAEMKGLPEFNLSDADRNSLSMVLNEFSLAYKAVGNDVDKLVVLKQWWEERKIPAPNQVNTPQQNKEKLTEITSALIADRRMIFGATRDKDAAEFNNFEERKAVVLKSVIFTALVAESKDLCKKIPILFEQSRDSENISRDDYFSCLVINDLAAQCQGSDLLSPEDLVQWIRFSKSISSINRVICLLTLQNVTQSKDDRRAVLNEYIQEQNQLVMNVFIRASEALPMTSRKELLGIVKSQNVNLSNEQKASIDQILALPENP